jgi:hypothetical protein
MTSDENKLEILRKVENGTLTIEEGSDLIGIIENAEKSQVNTSSDRPHSPMMPMEKREVSGCWKAGWSIFLLGGAVLTAFSAYWIYQGYRNNGFSWGFWLSWIPLIFGVLLMLFGWTLMESPWMHVRIRSKEGDKPSAFVFSMPLPLNLARWIMSTFGQYMPEEIRDKGILDILDQTEAAIKQGEPFEVQVDDDKDGSKVDIFIQ